ncbi:MFS transporter [Amycolatopsis sp. NPDC102389]|uniref:MFS transporter n=1 Tax=Amycolatopsis sp. NPDC102389 TaxID=3363941 RepID=UPI0037F2CAF5
MTAISLPLPSTMSTGRRWTVLAVCAAAMFLVGLDTTIVNVALPGIGRGLGAGTRGLQWVIDAYTVVFASLLITSGALADRFGRRRVFQLGLVTFGVASVLCAVAPSLGFLVAARVLQGAAASMLSPVALGIVVNVMTDPRERAKAIGIWASVFGLSMAAGPTAGGALLAVFDWRAVFWINVPVIVLAVLLVAVVVPESRGQRARRLDPPGQLLLIVLVGLTVGTLIEAPHLGWGSATAIGLYVSIVIVAAAFVTVERRRRDPLIDPALFRVPAFTGAVLGAIAVFVALSTTLLLTTFSLQDARGWTPLAAGMAVLPLAIGATVCAPFAGILVARTGTRLPLLLAGVLITAGGSCLLPVERHTSVLVLGTAYLLIGAGIGFANAPITTIAVSSLPPERAAVAGGTTSTARQVGASVGIALAGGLVTGVAPDALVAATRPGWLLVAFCGLVVLATAVTAAGRTSR